MTIPEGLQVGAAAVVFALIMKAIHGRLRQVKSDQDEARAAAIQHGSPEARALARWESARWVSITLTIVLLIAGLVAWSLDRVPTAIALAIVGGGAFVVNIVASVAAGLAVGKRSK